MAGFTTTEQQMIATLVVGLTFMFATFIAVFTVDKAGRKPALKIGFSVMALGTLVPVLKKNALYTYFLGGSMFVLGNILFAVARVLDTLLTLYFWVVIISALLTWVRPDPYNPVVRTLNALTEPVLYRIRKWLPFTYISGLDLSPIVVLVAIQLVQSIVVRSLFQYAAML